MKLLLTSCLGLLFSLALQAQNLNLSNGLVFDGEPYLAANPDNPQHLVVAWMGWKFGQGIVIKTRVSFDGGNNWSEAVALPHTSSGFTSADPSIGFDRDGRAYIAYVDFSGFDVSPVEGSIFLCKSVDGGLSWGAPVEVLNINADPGKQPIDRPWIAVDISEGPHSGNIYITSMNAKEASGPPYNPYLSISTDAGESFEPWRYLDTLGWEANLVPQPMPTPTVAADGSLHAIYPSWPELTSPAQYLIASSEDGGNSLSHHLVFSAQPGQSLNEPLAKKGYLLRSDPADANHLLFFYLAKVYDDADVFMRESFDKGQSWSEAQRINDDPADNGKMQDLVWADLDEDGDLAVCWRDRRNAAGEGYETDSEIWCAIRPKDSAEFLDNFPLSDMLVPYDVVLAQSGNDFMSLQFANDTLYAVWGDPRSGSLNIWFQRVAIDGLTSAVQLIASEQAPLYVYPNPAQTELFVQAEGIEKIRLFNAKGELVYSSDYATAPGKVHLPLADLPKGVYLLHCRAAQGLFTQKVVRK